MLNNFCIFVVKNIVEFERNTITMNREEEALKAGDEYLKKRKEEGLGITGYVLPAFFKGIEWSDTHPSGGAMLHILNKGVDIGKKQAFEKVNEFLKTFNIDDYISTISSGCCGITFLREKFISDIKKAFQDESR